MSVSKSKNLERKLDNFAKEAKNELNNVCGSSLWESLGFVFFDLLEDSEKIANANFYYGQLQIINEIIYFSISREPRERPNPPPPIATIFLLCILNRRFVYEYKTNYY